MNTDDSHERTVITKASEHIAEYLKDSAEINNEYFSKMFPYWQNSDIVLFPSALNEAYALKLRSFLKGKNIKMAAMIGASGVQVDPFGEASFTELISIYDEQVRAGEEIADLYVLYDMCSITDMRAALISCKKTEKPVYVFVKTDENGLTEEFEVPALGALITAQEMGADAFGISSDIQDGGDICTELIKYAKIPLIINNAYKHRSDDIQDDFFIFTHYNNIYFLEADTTEISEPIMCQPDMEEIITDICETSCDILRVQINTYDDAIDFARNAHMATRPVMFSSENELALKMALMLYQGIALIDSATMIPEDMLNDICTKYGAVVY